MMSHKIYFALIFGMCALVPSMLFAADENCEGQYKDCRWYDEGSCDAFHQPADQGECNRGDQCSPGDKKCIMHKCVAGMNSCLDRDCNNQLKDCGWSDESAKNLRNEANCKAFTRDVDINACNTGGNCSPESGTQGCVPRKCAAGKWSCRTNDRPIDPYSN